MYTAYYFILDLINNIILSNKNPYYFCNIIYIICKSFYLKNRISFKCVSAGPKRGNRLTCMGEERLSALEIIMNIEADVTTTMNYDDVIQEFGQDCARRKI